MERRLAAIMLTDIVGYSRLIGLDEEVTIARQKAHRAEIFEPKISAHGGRLVKSTGDGLLVEFPSVVDAVKCAVSVQEDIAQRDSDVSEDRRIRYRIGINLGDIVIDGDVGQNAVRECWPRNSIHAGEICGHIREFSGTKHFTNSE